MSDNDNPKPSAPRYESVANLHTLWRTSYSNLPGLFDPPKAVEADETASAPFMRQESIANLVRGQYAHDIYVSNMAQPTIRSVQNPPQAVRKVKPPMKHPVHRVPRIDHTKPRRLSKPSRKRRSSKRSKRRSIKRRSQMKSNKRRSSKRSQRRSKPSRKRRSSRRKSKRRSSRRKNKRRKSSRKRNF